MAAEAALLVDRVLPCVPAFVAVKLPATATAAAAAKEIAVRAGDVSVCVREDFDIEHLVRIVEALNRRRERGC
jgi:hypothetical protein